MSKSKRQGTAYEGKIKNELVALGWECTRLAEGGSLDPGDLLIELTHQPPIYVEARHRESMAIHGALAKALKKSGTKRTVMFWKRLVDTGKTMRQPVGGQAEVVVMDKQFFFSLLEDAYGTAPLDE